MIKIVMDSGGDIPAEMMPLLQGVELVSVPLTLTVDGQDFIDDDSLDVGAYLDVAEASPNGPTTAAPSPQRYLDAFGDSSKVFIITLSSKLSASFDSACLAARLRSEQLKGSLTHAFDSLSASVGEGLIAVKIAELARLALPDGDLIERVEQFIASMNTYFILDSLDTAVKTGRMSKAAGAMAELLRIKPVCAGVDGEMKVVGKARNYQRAVKQMIKMMRERANEQAIDLTERVLAISHVQAEQKAIATQAEVMAELPFKDSYITQTRGLSSTYAARGGIILAF